MMSQKQTAQIYSISHPEYLHPAGDPRPSPVAFPTWSAAAAGSADSFPMPAGAPWLQQKDDLADHSLAHFHDGAADAAKLDLTPTPQSVASGVQLF